MRKTTMRVAALMVVVGGEVAGQSVHVQAGGQRGTGTAFGPVGWHARVSGLFRSQSRVEVGGEAWLVKPGRSATRHAVSFRGASHVRVVEADHLALAGGLMARRWLTRADEVEAYLAGGTGVYAVRERFRIFDQPPRTNGGSVAGGENWSHAWGVNLGAGARLGFPGVFPTILLESRAHLAIGIDTGILGIVTVGAGLELRGF